MNSTGQILTLLRDRGPASRADLARMTGLSSAGLTKATSALMGQDILAEQQFPDHSGLGRPPMQLSLRREARFVLGIHLSPGRVSVIVTDVMLNLQSQDGFDFALPAAPEALARDAARLASRLIEAAGLPRGRLLGVGIGVPGGVDRNRRINTHSLFTGWSQVPFAALFEDLLGLPAILEHNATAIALAEAQFGSHRSAARTLHVFMGKGIGAGLAQGALSPAGEASRGPVELGHIVMDPDGAECSCGNRGCLETFFSERALLAAAGLAAVPPQGLLAAAMQSDDWPRIYDGFVQALSTTVTLLAPDLVVLGGHLNAAPDRLLADLRRDLPRRVIPQLRPDLSIQRSALAEPVGARGAACVALEAFFYRAGPVPAFGLARIDTA